MPPPRGKLVLLAAFFLAKLFMADPVSAQSNFFTVHQPSQVQMTTEQNDRYLALQDTGFSKSVLIVSTADIRTSQANDTILLPLPGSSDTLIAEASLISDDSLDGFLWSGRLLNQPGYVSFLYRAGRVAGFLQTKGDFYELMPLDSNYQFWVERNNTELLPCGLPEVSPPPPDSSGPGPNACDMPPGIDTYNTCPALVSVLLVFTGEAKDWVINHNADIDAYVQLGQAAVNQAFYNSDIPNKEIRIKWVEYPESLEDILSDPPDIDADRALLSALLEDLRDENSADIAILVTNQSYDAAGIASGIGPSTENAYALVEAPYFNAQLVFAHELGHLLGGRHNWPGVDAGDDPMDVCAHAYRHIPTPPNVIYDDPDHIYTVANSWITLIGIPAPVNTTLRVTDGTNFYYAKFALEANERILHYSNPDVLYGLLPTGRDEGAVANNALFIRNNACTVAGFYPTHELAATISYPYATESCNPSTTFTAYLHIPESGIPGQAPYTVNWYWNTTGIFTANNPGTYLGQGVQLTLNDHLDCPVYWLKCVIISSDGVTISRVRKIIVGPSSCCIENEERKSNEKGNLVYGKIIPNPVIRGEPLLLSMPENDNYGATYQIMDALGHITGPIKALPRDSRLDVGQLAPGVYWLRVKMLSSGESNIFKFFIL